MTIGGWCFNNDVQSYELVGQEQKHQRLLWSEMSISLLKNLLARLEDNGRWEPHVEEIKDELESRVPLKTITSVTVTGKL